MMPLFDWLVSEASSFAEAKHIHRRIITLDSHCDTPMFFSEGFTAKSLKYGEDVVTSDSWWLPIMKTFMVYNVSFMVLVASTVKEPSLSL